MSVQPPRSKTRYIDNPSVSETVVDGVHAIGIDSAMARITLTVRRPLASDGGAPPAEITTTASRLVMPLDTFIEVYEKLHQIIMQLEKKGLVKAEPRRQ